MKKGLRNNNSGMTLVELIVAIAIFVAAIVPMLYAFVYSTGFNFKSQRTMQSTGIAQAIAEQCKSVNFDYSDLQDTFAMDGNTILDGSQFTVNGNAGGDKEGVNRGMYWMYGVRATNNTTDGTTTRRAYDVAIDFRLITDSVTDYSSIQSMGHTTYNFGDSLSTALRNEDRVAQAKAIEKIKELFLDSNVTCSETLPTLPTGTLKAFFSESDIDVTDIVLDREIIITVSNPDTYNDPSGGSGKESVQVIVDYYCGADSGDDGIADTGNFRITHTARISGHDYNLVISKPLDADYTYDTHATPIYSVDMGTYTDFNEAASAVYFYYYPGYKSINSDTANYRDHFIINNNMTVNAKDHDDVASIDKLDFYLFKQYDHDLDVASHVTYDDREENYACDISMNSAGHDTFLYHNLYWKVVEDVSQSPHVFKLQRLVAAHFSVTEGSNCHSCTIPDSSFTTYGSSYKKYNSTWTLPNDDGLSHVLSNYASLPYRHLDYTDYYGTDEQLFEARYRISIYIYPAGDNAAGNEIEIMTFEMLNW